MEEKERKVLERILDRDRHRPNVAVLLDSLSSATCAGISNNKTGSQTTIKFKVPGRRAAIKVKCKSHCISHYGRSDFARNDITGGLWRAIREDFALGDLHGAAQDAYKRADLFTFGMHTDLTEVLLSRAPAFADLLDRTVRSLQSSDDHVRKERSHQSGMALEDARKSVRKALENGASRDDVIALLDEEVARTVMEG